MKCARRFKRGKRFVSFAPLALGFFVFFLVGFGFYIIYLLRTLPSLDQFSSREVSQSTKLYDRTGQILLYEIHGEEKRTVIPFDQMPDYLKKATLAAEDANFYNEPAFDWTGMVRAFINDIKSGSFSQGGSTISQQLVKNVLLSSERTLSRKLKEFVLAIELESKYTKDQIFSFYLNQIPYGSNAYGAEAASQVYYNKSAKDLTLAEAATLAALLKAPTYFSPWGSHEKELLDRKDYVLDRMKELKFITDKEWLIAKKEQITFAPPSLGSIQAPHFTLAVKDYLTNRYGENLVTNGGLRVITTLDMNLQQIAERVVVEGADRNEQLYSGKNSALVAEDAKTGQVLALVGSKNYFDIENEGNFNVAMQGLRQPGSALKPFVYLTAFQKGYPPTTILYDVQTEFDTRGDPTKSYQPQNYDERFRGPVMMQDALAQSINIPAVKTLYLAGFDDVLKTLHTFGVTTLNERWRYGLSLTLGGGEIKLIDMVKAYSVLSQEGVLHDQTLVLRVEDNQGNVLEEYHDDAKRVVDPQYPRLINQILSDPQLRSPLFQLSLNLTVFPDHDVALKTGTTEDYRDAWAFGYTPSLVVGVWAGNNDNTPMQRHGSSILAAVPIWSAFLRETLTKYPTEAFQKPDPVPPAAKPMLNGESEFSPVINGHQYPQVHTILYYTNRNDPLGPPPEHPEEDTEFDNWEGGVLGWARMNIPNFSAYNQPLPTNVSFTNPGSLTLSDISIKVIQPRGGAFVSNPFSFRADINAPHGLARIELYFNHQLIHGFDADGTFYPYQFAMNVPLNTQNLLELKVRDTAGNVSSASVVVFH